MREIERIVREVDSSMAMEGLPLTVEDKDRTAGACPSHPSLEQTVWQPEGKHTVSASYIPVIVYHGATQLCGSVFIRQLRKQGGFFSSG